MLNAGDRFRYEGHLYEVAYVNECRAHCLPIDRVHRSFVDQHGLVVEFDAPYGPPVNLSPKTLVRFVRSD